MKHSAYELQVQESGRWDVVTRSDDLEQVEKLRATFERAYSPETVRVRRVVTQEVFETVPGKTDRGHKRVETSQGNVDVSVTNEHESVIRLPERDVVIYLLSNRIEITHPIGANLDHPTYSATMFDAPLMQP
jgi:hypothetical protein